MSAIVWIAPKNVQQIDQIVPFDDTIQVVSPGRYKFWLDRNARPLATMSSPIPVNYGRILISNQYLVKEVKILIAAGFHICPEVSRSGNKVVKNFYILLDDQTFNRYA